MLKEKLADAESRLNEAAENGTALDCAYWRGYRDALRSLSTARVGADDPGGPITAKRRGGYHPPVPAVPLSHPPTEVSRR